MLRLYRKTKSPLFYERADARRMDVLLCDGNGASPTRVAGGMIRERAGLRQGELERRSGVDGAAIEKAGRIGCHRMRNRIAVGPCNCRANLHLQRFWLEACAW